VQVAAGQLGGPPVPSDQLFQFTVSTLGRLSDVAEFESIIIKSHPPATQATQVQTTPQVGQTAAVVRLQDVAKVELSQQGFTTLWGLSGKKAAQMNVYTLPGANALKVAQAVQAEMAQLSKDFPAGLRYTALLDTSAFVRDSIHGVYLALLQAGILV